MSARSFGALLFAALLLFVLVAVFGVPQAQPDVARAALTPQGCVTECQTRQTDCILACEGRVPCERQCVIAGKACERRCVGLADAGAAGAGGQGGSSQR